MNTKTTLARIFLAAPSLALALALAAALPAWAQAPALSGETFEILVRTKATAPAQLKSSLLTRLQAQSAYHNSEFDVQVWKVPSQGKASEAAILDAVRADPAVDWAEPNYLRYPSKTPNDPLFSQQWHLLNRGQQGGLPGADIQAAAAWDSTTGDRRVVVAVVDTGIDYAHPDIQGNLWVNPREIPGNGKDDDGNGYVDDYHGIDATADTGDPMDDAGHGTHVAGIIGAVGDNGVGVSGVNWRVSLMALKFMTADGGTVADELKCLAYVLDQHSKGVPVRVVNASFGSGGASRFEEEAIAKLQDAGIMVAAAAGNDGGELGVSANNYPAQYRLMNIISVAASDARDTLASFSNYGFYSVDLTAPGVDIVSTYPNAAYRLLSGTSMAAPQVSGALALLSAALNPGVLEARERLLRGAAPKAGLDGKVFSGGRLDVARALGVALAGPYIFDLSPTSGPPGTPVTLKGVRFGTAPLPGSQVDFDGKAASVVSWRDDEIVVAVPADAAAGQSGTLKVQARTPGGDSNTVLFRRSAYRYFLPYAPADASRQSVLILCNYSNETVSANVFAGPSDAWAIKPVAEVLLPLDVVYRNVGSYNLSGDKNLLWVESPQDIGVDLMLFNYANGNLRGLSFIPSERR